jgi:diacylglycerol kinase family enzyme
MEVDRSHSSDGSAHDSMSSRREPRVRNRRIAALIALVTWVAAICFVVVVAVRNFPRGLIAAVFLVLAFTAIWEATLRRGAARIVLTVLGALLLVGFGVALVVGEMLAEVLVLAVLLGVVAMSVRWAFRIHVPLPVAEPPKRPVVVWNAKSGGGKATAAHLDVEARARGIEPIELCSGDDWTQVVRDAVANGADALAAAGGDGTQALVATIAAELDLPFACIPAGTRNHFALDLGVDRDDVVGALDAFVNGGERRVDLAEVNGRVFVNNVSLGLYAEAVQHAGYREAKLRTVLDTMPDFGGASGGQHPFSYSAPTEAAERVEPIVVMVSNNSYRLRKAVGSGTRPRIDDGRLGLAVLATPAGRTRPRFTQWEAPTFEIDSEGPVPAGVDGEALMLDPPLLFAIRPGVLRVRIAPQHPGASPSAAHPEGVVDSIKRLLRIVRTGDPLADPPRRGRQAANTINQ